MAIAVDLRQTGGQTLAGNVSGATSMSWTHTLGSLSKGILVACVQQDASGVTTGVNWDDGGTNVAMTRKSTAITGACRADIWYLVGNPHATTGAKTIRASWSGSHHGCGGSASYSGVDQTTIFNAASPQTATGNGTAVSLAVTSAAGEMVIDSVVHDLSGTGAAQTKGASQDYIATGANSGAGSIDGSASDQVASGASTTMSWTLNRSDPWAQAALSLKVDAGGGGGATVTYPMLERHTRGLGRGAGL
jgi:hypothetical protein